MQSQITRAALALLTGGVLLVGCQSYEPRPLDLDAHRAAWLERSPDSERVTDFARRLEAQGDAPVTFDPSDGLSRREAEVIALVFNPDLRLARLRAGVAGATAGNADAWDDPEFEIAIQRATSSVPSRWTVTPALALTIPISGRLEAEIARADAALQAELERIAEAEWSVRDAIRREWLVWTAASLRAEETARLIDSMDSLVASTSRLAEVGEMPRTEAALFAIDQTQRRSELRGFRGDIAEAEQRLRMHIGLAPSAPVEFVPALEIDDVEPSVDAMAARNPSLARLRQDYAVAEKTLNREIRKQYPDLTIGPLYETDQGQSKIGVLGGVPVPIFNANKQAIAEAEAEREFARAAFETEFERLAGTLAATNARANALRGQREEMASVMAPMVDRQLDDARRLLELGEGGGLVLLESLVRAHETRLSLVDIRRDEALAAAEIAFLIGPALGARTPEQPLVDADPEVNP